MYIIRIFFLLLLLSLSSGCDYSYKHPDVNIKISHNTKILYACKKALVTKTYNDGHSGFRFDCKTSDVYVVYDTNVRKDGTIKRIDINLKYDKEGNIVSQISLSPAVRIKTRGSKRCDSALKLNRMTGEAPFVEDEYGYIKEDEYKLEMSDPCGTVLFKIHYLSK
ncbi:MAG: hypothetical protein H7A25_20070 [Leptospiraceae bacterium]|nr:hypothetical protein [Leptospiraceae bacterium]MCP5502206.1 hypothetical protein [Leptospiraceae bacterium]